MIMTKVLPVVADYSLAALMTYINPVAGAAKFGQLALTDMSKTSLNFQACNE